MVFNPAQIEVVSQGVEIAEDVTANFFKISTAQWRHVRYDIRTLAELKADEVTSSAFAQIIRYSSNPDHSQIGDWHFDYFKICLQDHNMMAAVERDASPASSLSAKLEIPTSKSETNTKSSKSQ